MKTDHTWRIYKVTNMVNGRAYIGITKNTVEWRIWRHHQYNTSLLGRALRKYGRDSFVVEILADGLTLEKANTLERRYVSLYGTMVPYGYNMHPGGRNGTWKPGEQNPNAKLTAAQVMEIRSMAANGVKYLDIMGRFKLSSDKYVGAIVRGHVWS